MFEFTSIMVFLGRGFGEHRSEKKSDIYPVVQLYGSKMIDDLNPINSWDMFRIGSDIMLINS